MNGDDKLFGLIDFIYEAVLDNNLWPSVLGKLADAMGGTQTIVATTDWRVEAAPSAVEGLDFAGRENPPEFRDPLWIQTTTLPAGAIFSPGSFMSGKGYLATPTFNEWWRPAEADLGKADAHPLSEDRVPSLICVVNAPGKDFVTDEQTLVFKTVLRHLDRAVRIHRRLRSQELNPDAAQERLEGLLHGAFLVDAAARVLFANAAAKTMLDAGDGLVLRDDRLAASDGSRGLQIAIASCAPSANGRPGFGGEVEIRRGSQRSPVRVNVTPLKAQRTAVEVPWLASQAPVALVIATDPDLHRRRLERNLRRDYGLTIAESRLAAEIVKGDGRKAAAARRGISDATARTQLSSIFAKTGTHRQAELIRLVLAAADGKGDENDGRA
jgi:DNA-binding CsgD family transcriptional regulator